MGEAVPVTETVLDLFTLGALPVLLAAFAACAGLSWIIAGRLSKVRFPLFLAASLCLCLGAYVTVASPGYEGWQFATRPDRSEVAGGAQPQLIQVQTRLANDADDPEAWLAVAQLFMDSAGQDPQSALLADEAFRAAEESSRLSADAYAKWAELLIFTSLDQAEGYQGSAEEKIQAALSQDPMHAVSRYLSTLRMGDDAALSELRALALEVSPAEPLAEQIDARIASIVIGDKPSIAPDLATVDQDRWAQVVEGVAGAAEGAGEGAGGGQPPFLAMVSRLAAGVANVEGEFFEPTGDPDIDQAFALTNYRLGAAQVIMGEVGAAVSSLERAQGFIEPADGLNYWIAEQLWSAGRPNQGIALLERYHATMDEGSPEWRSVGGAIRDLEALLTEQSASDDQDR